MVAHNFKHGSYEGDWNKVANLHSTPDKRREQIGFWEFQVKRAMRWGIFFALGWAACASYYRVEHLWAQRSALVTQKTALVKELNCEHNRAETALGFVDSGDLPPPSVTNDCPHPNK